MIYITVNLETNKQERLTRISTLQNAKKAAKAKAEKENVELWLCQDNKGKLELIETYKGN